MKRKFTIYLLSFLIFITFTLISFTALFSYKKSLSTSSYLTVHFIDVGQGDCIFIQTNTSTILIDSGPATAQKKLFKYLDSLKINKFDYVIATHPHEDHIGNMASIIKKYSINKFYAPKATTSSTSFENMVTALNDKGLKISVISNKLNTISLDTDTYLNFYTLPNLNDNDDLNLFSPLIKLTFKNISFLFTGDAELPNEEYLISTGANLQADILKVGHHGSSTSTSEDFLKAVSPKVAIISVGKDNDYGHPTEETLNTLNKYNIKIYRTDLLGNIIISSDGFNFSVSHKKK